MKRILLASVVILGASAVLMGQTYTIKTVAGSLPPTATSAGTVFLAAPDGVLVDSTGNLYISDTSGNRVWKIDSTGALTRIAGDPNSVPGSGGDGAAAVKASLSSPVGLAMDAAGNLYIADNGNSKIRKVDTSGVITTFAGVGNGRFSGDGRKATQADLNGPRGLAMDKNGNLFVADTGNGRVRKINPSGIITTVAGSTSSTSTPSGCKDYDSCNGDGGLAVLARLDSPSAVAVDSSGNIYIADTSSFGSSDVRTRSNRIRKVDTKGNISTIAGRTLTNYEQGKDVNGNTDPRLSAVKSPYSGSACGVQKQDGTACANIGDGRDATTALLASPFGLAVDSSGNVFVSDRDDNRVRLYNAASGSMLTVVGTGGGGSTGDGGPGTLAQTNKPAGLFLDSSGNLYITEEGSGRVRKFDTNAGVVYNAAGYVRSSSDGPALSVAFNSPRAVAVDAAGNVYVADTNNHKIRKIDTQGNVTTLAGTGSSGSTADGSPGVGSRINSPRGIAVDSTGTIYFAENGNNRVRTLSGGVLGTLAGGGAGAPSNNPSGDGLAATTITISSPTAVALDGMGNVYFTETGKNVVREVLTNGTIMTIAGQYGVSGGAGDGGSATNALLNGPTGIWVDTGTANSMCTCVYVADTSNHVVRVIAKDGNIYPVAGEMGSNSYDGPSTSQPAWDRRFRNPEGVAVDAKGNPIIADTRNDVIRFVDITTGLTTNITTSSSGASEIISFNDGGGDASKAQVSWPRGLFVDAAGNIFVADSANGMIREISPTPPAAK